MRQVWERSDAEIECILVDDCTPDNSMTIAQDLIEKYEGNIHFICIRHEINLGLSAARNSGIASATGDYVFLIDSDDYIAPKTFKTFIKYLKEYPDAEVIMGQAVKTPSKEYYSQKTDKPQITRGTNNILNLYFKGNLYTSGWNKLVKRELFDKYNIQFVEGIFFEDTPWTYQLFSHISTVILIPETTYYYTYNPSGIMATRDTAQNITKTIKSYTEIIQHLYESQPDKEIFFDISVDFYLYIHNILTQGIYLIITKKIPAEIQNLILVERKTLMKLTLKNRMFLISLFNLLLYKPFCMLLRISFIRKNYSRIQKCISRLAHLTDFMHHSPKYV